MANKRKDSGGELAVLRYVVKDSTQNYHFPSDSKGCTLEVLDTLVLVGLTVLRFCSNRKTIVVGKVIDFP